MKLGIFFLSFSLAGHSQTKSQTSESASITRWLAESPLTPKSQVKEYSRQDRVIRFSDDGKNSVVSIPFNLPSGVKTTILEGRVFVIEDESGSLIPMGFMGPAKKIFLDLGEFLDPNHEEPQAKMAYVNEDGEFRFTSRQFRREKLYDESLFLTRYFLSSDLAKKKAPRDGYRNLKSQSGMTSVYFSKDAVPPLILGDNWRAVQSMQRLTANSFQVVDHEGSWKIEFEDGLNTYQVKKLEPPKKSENLNESTRGKSHQ